MNRTWPLLLLNLLACSGQPSSPIPTAAPKPDAATLVDVQPVVVGVADRGRDPAIVGIEVGGQLACSGVVIASNVVLTARSCTVTLTSPPLACPAQGLQVESNLDPATLAVATGDDTQTLTLAAHGFELVIPLTGIVCDDDIAALIVDANLGIPPVKPTKELPTTWRVARTVAFDSTGMKLLREYVPVIALSPAELEIAEITCDGEIGGAAFDESGDGLIGIVSRSGSVCTGEGVHDIYTRIDVHQDLIQAALTEGLAQGGVKMKAAAKPDTDVGAPCASAADCSTGVCVEATPGAGYCSHRCGTVTCPTGYHCTVAEGDKFCFEK